MKKITILTILCFSFNAVFSQTPANGTIENAIEITQENYFEQNVRLDLAPNNLGGQVNCNLTGFTSVFYKFTASTDATTNIFLTDSNGNAILQDNSFVIVFSAPNLNVTNNNQLTTVSACQFGTSSSINMVTGTSYYVLINRQEANVLSNIQITLPQDIPVSEKQALLDLYNSTDGPNWTQGANWFTNIPASQWDGIEVANGHVKDLFINNYNLTGTLNQSLVNLTLAEGLFLSGNNLSGEIPDLSSITTLDGLNLVGNSYSFTDIETNFTNNSTIPNFFYNNQKDIDNPITIEAVIGNDYSFDITPVTGTNLQYQWVKIRNVFGEEDEIITGETNLNYNITNTQSEDLDNYTCLVTSPTIPDLTIKRATIKLTAPVSQLEKEALIALYNTTDGPNWNNNANWLSNLPVGEWEGVTTQGDKVIVLNLNFFGLNGALPDEIGDLVNLEELRISVNPNLIGSIPSSIGNLTELKWLRFQFNGMSGEIPVTVGNLSSLKRLYLINNSFSGEVPSQLSNLNNLEQLFIGGNEFSGSVPELFNNMPNLVSLGLNDNQFSSSLPTSINNTTNLQFIDVSSNNFENTIPDLTSFPDLENLNIADNEFQFGDFETEFSNYLSNITSFTYAPQKRISEDELQFVSIGDNIVLNATASGINNTYQWFFSNQPLTGENNPSLILSNIQLSQIGNYYCSITNSVVSNLELLTGVTTLDLNPLESPDYNDLIAFYNAMNGDNWINNTNWLDTNVPLSLWNGLTVVDNRVTEINLVNNNLTGSIPDEIANLTNLERFDFNINNVFGSINPLLGSLTNLTYIDLRNNNLTGTIPNEITQLNNLFVFVVSNNNLEGNIPDFTALTNTTVNFFWFDNNKFQFGDFETEFASYLNSPNTNLNFSYAPQKLLAPIENISLDIGETTTITTNVSGTQNNYFWIKRDPITGGGTVISQSQDFNITINNASDYGDYYLEVTSGLVSNLLLQTPDFTIGPDPSTHPDYNALLAFYNATNGPNWTIPWNINAPIQTWDSNSDSQIIFDTTNNRVTSLDVRDLNLSGTLPSEIDGLTELKILNLDSENLTGHIPPEIGNLTNLEDLFFIGCDFTGEVPIEIWNLTNIKNLLIGIQASEQLTLNNGIPASISNLQNLEWLNLTFIPISQPLPTELFNLPNLNKLRIANCGLSGTVPAGISQIPDVIISGNDFIGPLPAELLNAVGNTSIRLNGCFFDFSDLEPLVSSGNYGFVEYSPQRTMDQPLDIQTTPNQDITLTVDDTNINRVANSSQQMNNAFQWFKDEQAIMSSNSSSYTIINAQEADSGVYYAEITNPLLPDLVIRRADINILINPSLSLDNIQEETITIYPNPTRNYVNVKIGNNKVSKVYLYDSNGRLLFEKEISFTRNLIDLSNYSEGLYLLKIINDNKEITKKIIKN